MMPVRPPVCDPPFCGSAVLLPRGLLNGSLPQSPSPGACAGATGLFSEGKNWSFSCAGALTEQSVDKSAPVISSLFHMTILPIHRFTASPIHQLVLSLRHIGNRFHLHRAYGRRVRAGFHADLS